MYSNEDTQPITIPYEEPKNYVKISLAGVKTPQTGTAEYPINYQGGLVGRVKIDADGLCRVLIDEESKPLINREAENGVTLHVGERTS